MRNALRFAAEAVLVLLLGVGCASTAPRAEVTAMPTADELPDLSAVEGIIPLNVGVERDFDQPRLILVTRFSEPELTPEERAILGEDEDLGYDPLELYRPTLGPEQGIEPLAQGPLSSVYGWGGAAVRVGPFAPIWGIGADMGGPATRITIHPRTLSAAASARIPPWAVGPRSTVEVGDTGSARRVAAPQPDGSK